MITVTNTYLRHYIDYLILLHLITCYKSATDNTFLFRNAVLQKQRPQYDLTEHSFFVVTRGSWTPLPKIPLVLACKCPAARYHYLEIHESHYFEFTVRSVFSLDKRRGTHCYCLVLLYHGMSVYANGDDYTSYRQLNERFCVTNGDFIRRELITLMTEGYCLLGRGAV